MNHVKFLLIAGFLFAGLGVALGAFGAHALEDKLQATGRLDTYETAVKYQFYHALGLILLGLLAAHFPSPYWWYAGVGNLVGILLFSGSLYILCLSNVSKWGMVTPIGGLALMISWGLAIYAAFKSL